jgi:hypothetical protein
MRHHVWTLCVLSLVSVVAVLARNSIAQQPADKWSMNATIIEACSCPMFCPCYFDTKPAPPTENHAAQAGHDHSAHADHAGGGGCMFNNAFKVNKGEYNGTNLAGAKFWVNGDLGSDFSKGQMDWAVLTFDPSVTKEQREGITKILGAVYPVKWNSFTVGPDKPIAWEANKDRAVAKLDDGKMAEVALKRYPGNTSDPIVINNLKYWGVPRNDGFVLMPNEVNAFRQPPSGKQPFEFKNSNGFMITFDINSDDVKK